MRQIRKRDRETVVGMEVDQNKEKPTKKETGRQTENINKINAEFQVRQYTSHARHTLL